MRQEIASTEISMEIFDGITYDKGAAVFNYLIYLIGHKNFGEVL